MKMENSHLFPLFLDLTQKKILVVGAGNIATRRIETLLHFLPEVTVVAPEASTVIEYLAENGKLHWLRKNYDSSDLKSMWMVLAATNDVKKNEEICEECRKQGILVNVASNQQLCDFQFPGVVLHDELTIGINASGQNHRKAKMARVAIENYLQGENL